MSCEWMPKWLQFILEYGTQKNVSIPNYTVGAIYRILQLLILAYVVCWIFLYEKSYQMTDDAVTSVFSKVKGVGFTNFSENSFYGKRVWDIYDLVVPPLEANALFVVTNIVVTSNQSLSKCPEAYSSKESRCMTDSDCTPGYLNHVGNGAYSGKCIQIPGKTEGICEIHSWCPLENDTLPLGYGEPMFPMVANFTMFIKAQAAFEEFGVHRRNIMDWMTKDFLERCQYDGEHEKNKYCPVFKFSKIFEEAKVESKMLVMGGAIGIYINWDCDFDWNPDYCKPKYSFVRLHEKDAKISPGYNYRYAQYYYVDGKLHRDLYKVYGIRFLIQARGQAGKFHMLPFTLALGSGIGWVGLASVICDIILTKIVKARAFYDERTTETVSKEEEAEFIRKLLLDKMNKTTEKK